MAKHADTGQLRAYIESLNASPDEIVEAIRQPGPMTDMTEGMASARSGAARNNPDSLRRAAEKLATGQEMTPDEVFVTEAIIIPDLRPAIDIQDGRYSVAHRSWLHFNGDPIRKNILAAIPAAGRIGLPGHPLLPYCGTGFVVGPDLVMTNRHVAEIFCSGLGYDGLSFTPGQQPRIDLRCERDRADSIDLRLAAPVIIHPEWDMALLRVEGLPPDIVPLTLSTAEIESMEQEDVAVIGYPAFDPRSPADVQDQVFGGVYNVKRLMPGKLGARMRVNSFGRNVDAATHDGSTLGGASGSAVVRASTGEVVALHFGGIYRQRNYAVPACELARDGRVVDSGLHIAGSPAAAPRRDDSTATTAETPVRVSIPAGGGGATLPLTITITVGVPQ